MAAADKITFLHHPSSQPCRAIEQFMLLNGIAFNVEVVDIINGANEAPEWREKYNPCGQVPVIVDGDQVVWESSAIAMYLAEKFKVPEKWFGATLQERSRVNTYISWHASNLRAGAAVFFYTYFAECAFGKGDYSAQIIKGRGILSESMDTIEGHFLKTTEYVAGNEVSYADLCCYHEFVSHNAGKLISDEEYAKYPKISAWLAKMDALEHSDAVSEGIKGIAKMRMDGIVIPMKRTHFGRSCPGSLQKND